MMKTIITLLLLFVGPFAFAQQFNDKMKDAFKTDNATVLLAEIKAQKANVGDCFDVEGVSYSLLSISIKMQRPQIFSALIAAKADVNKICNDKSPLMYAAKYGQLDFAKALVKAGADAALANKEGQTALSYATKYDKKEVQAFLSTIKTTK